MTNEEKYSEYTDLFYDYFIVEGLCIKGSNIPASFVVFKDGKSKSLNVGDGTINMAQYLLYLVSKYLVCEEQNQEICINRIGDVLQALNRLSETPLKKAFEQYPGINFSYEPGFFLRDDISIQMKESFKTEEITSAYGMLYEGKNEDPCFSPFVSQDQIWNLAPILSFLSKGKIIKDPWIVAMSQKILTNILDFVIKNNHTIYNPYWSSIYHYWTYPPTFNTNKVKPWDRIKDREDHLKYKIKVKRGANNWYYAYGFRKTFEKNCIIGKYSKFVSFLYSLIYYPLTFCAEKIYFPIMHRIFGTQIKNNSYHCLAVSGEVWFGGRKNFLKHLSKCFKRGEFFELSFIEALKSGNFKSFDPMILKKFLDEYPEPVSTGTMNNPLDYLITYNFYDYLTSL